MRLIDADALKEKLQNKMFSDTDKMRLSEKLFYESITRAFFEEIDEQPTENIGSNWITCEERLPEMKKKTAKNSFYTDYDSDPVIVQTKRGEIFLAICRKTEYANSMRKNMIDWHTFGTNGREMKVMSKVVTWMPKPEAWKPNFEQWKGKENATN